MPRRSAGLILTATLLFGAPKGLPKGEGSNKHARIEATAYLDKQAIAQALDGGELPAGIVVIEVKLTPSPGQKLTIDREDFLLRSDRDGQRSTPYAPSQIAGASVLRVSTRAAGGGLMTEDRGPIWGGLGGGMPGRLPGSGNAIGNSGSATEAVATADEGGRQKEDPVLAILKKKILDEKEISEPVTGQLYFLMEGKQKVKDIELLYKTADGKIPVRFKQLP